MQQTQFNFESENQSPSSPSRELSVAPRKRRLSTAVERGVVTENRAEVRVVHLRVLQEMHREEIEEIDRAWPQTYATCVERDLGTITKPCFFVRCGWNLLLDLNMDTGSIRLSHATRNPITRLAEIDVDSVRDTCTLRFIDEVGEDPTLERVGDATGLTRERIRQLVDKIIAKIRRQRKQLLALGVEPEVLQQFEDIAKRPPQLPSGPSR